MLVEVEGGGDFHVSHPVVQVDTGMQFVLVKAQFLLAAHQEHIQQVAVRWYIETLELVILQVQTRHVLLQIAVAVHITCDIFKGICLACHLSLLVEHEEIQVLVVPVIDIILETNLVCRVVHT